MVLCKIRDLHRPRDCVRADAVGVGSHIPNPSSRCVFLQLFSELNCRIVAMLALFLGFEDAFVDKSLKEVGPTFFLSL